MVLPYSPLHRLATLVKGIGLRLLAAILRQRFESVRSVAATMAFGLLAASIKNGLTGCA
jgi:hypothetical protein